jgi:hypothetical protein
MEPFLLHLSEEEAVRQESYREYRDYYDGRHGVPLTDRQRQYLRVAAGQEFSANYMPIVVDSLSGRLRVMRFEALDDKPLTKTLNTWLRQMKLDAVQGGVHTSAVRDGDSYGFVEWDARRRRPRLTPHLAYDGRDGIHAYYSPDEYDPILFAKRWTVEIGTRVGLRRLNLYYPDRVERYWSHASSGNYDWAAGTGPEQKPLPAVSPYAHGLPVVHFTNRSRGFRYGVSEIAPGIPMQDALNKSIIDLLAAADASGFRIIFALGFDPSGLHLAPGSLVGVPDVTPDEAQVIVVPGEALRPHIETVDSFVQRIGQVTDTPLSYFQQSGQMASEGTHRQHEARMLAKCRAASVEFGEKWEQIMLLAIRMSNLYDGTAYDEDAEIMTIWDDFDIREREEKVLARAQAAKALVESNFDAEESAIQAGFSEEAAKRLADVEFLQLETMTRGVNGATANPQPANANAVAGPGNSNVG